MFSAIARVLRTPDLRRKIAFTLGIIVVYRLGAHIPSPFVDFSSNSFSNFLRISEATLLTCGLTFSACVLLKHSAL